MGEHRPRTFCKYQQFYVQVVNNTFFFNPFPADVANKRHLDSALKSHFCDLTGETEVIGLFDLLTLFTDLGVYIANKRKEH
jgi:hypothetical protein